MVPLHLLRGLVAIGVGSAGCVFVCLTKDYSPLYFHALFMTVFFLVPLLELVKVVFFLLTDKEKAKRDKFIKRHQLLAFFVEATVGLGIVAIQYKKSKENLPHFSSSHAMWGGACAVCILLEAILGALLMYVIPKRSPIRMVVRLFHRFLFFPLFISAAYAFGSGWLQMSDGTEFFYTFCTRVWLCGLFFLVLHVFFVKPFL